MRIEREAVWIGEPGLRRRAVAPADLAVAGQGGDVWPPVQQGRDVLDLGDGPVGQGLGTPDHPGRDVDGRQHADRGNPLLQGTLHSGRFVHQGAHRTN